MKEKEYFNVYLLARIRAARVILSGLTIEDQVMNNKLCSVRKALNLLEVTTDQEIKIDSGE